MYIRPELEEAHEEFWTLIRGNLNIDCPETLSQNAGEIEVWTSPNLFFSQTCGLPYRKFLNNKVTLIGTPDYGLDDCPPAYYRSGYIVHLNASDHLSDYKDKLFTYNDKNSQSGYYVTNNLFEKTICSGSHINSAKMVASGKADIATIDAVSLKFMRKYDDFATDLKVIEWTKPTPALPFIAYKGADKEMFFTAIVKAINDMPDELMIKDIINIPQKDYLSMV